MTPEGVRLYQCGNGRWHAKAKGEPLAKACDWGLMPYYDARVAHEAVRRIRYRIPPWWEWIVVLGVVLGEATRLAIGTGGLLNLLR